MYVMSSLLCTYVWIAGVYGKIALYVSLLGCYVCTLLSSGFCFNVDASSNLSRRAVGALPIMFNVTPGGAHGNYYA
jgi:hypothetical protein